MIIFDEITVPSQTSVTTPVEIVYPVCSGTLTTVTIIPAKGPNWELYFRLLHFETSIIPDNTDQWIPLEGYKLDFYRQFKDWQDVYKLTLQLCSPQARYEHTVHILLTIEESSTAQEILSRIYNEGVKR